MLRTLYHKMLQNNETHLRISAALNKIAKECPTILGKLCDKQFRDVLVRYRTKFLNIACYIFLF